AAEGRQHLPSVAEGRIELSVGGVADEREVLDAPVLLGRAAESVAEAGRDELAVALNRKGEGPVRALECAPFTTARESDVGHDLAAASEARVELSRRRCSGRARSR